jgi:putative endonuclease
LLELIRDPRIMTAAVAKATIALRKGLRAANQKFVFMLFSQAFEDRYFILLRADALRRIAIIRRAKQDALRSFSKGGPPVYYVYLIESLSAARERYVGITSNLEQRLREHNAGKSSHTSKFKPWKLTTYVALTDRVKAEAFERYLKSGSGHAFARKHLW